MMAGSHPALRAGRVAIVTDSAASLPDTLIASAQVIVVPLRLVANGVTALDGDENAAGRIAAFAATGGRLTTARPAPEHFEAAYRQAAAEGAVAVVSVNLSAALSGTVASAELAAAVSPVPVTVTDGRSIGIGLGLTVLAAAAAAGHGRPADEVASIARWHADRSKSFFAVDSAAALAAGGRWSDGGQGSAGGLGNRPAVLVTRPILQLADGRISLVERVRTRSAAAGRLAELGIEAASVVGRGSDGVDVGVQHTAAPERAADLSGRIAAAVPDVRNLYLVEAGLVITAHAGRGILGVAIGPHVPD